MGYRCPLCGDNKAYAGFKEVECNTSSCPNFRKPKVTISAKGKLDHALYESSKAILSLPDGTSINISQNRIQSKYWVPRTKYPGQVTWRDMVDFMKDNKVRKVELKGTIILDGIWDIVDLEREVKRRFPDIYP